jgi:hypothetical protein
VHDCDDDVLREGAGQRRLVQDVASYKRTGDEVAVAG